MRLSPPIRDPSPPSGFLRRLRYFRAVREIGVGSLHVAHVNKSENADKKPFGSSFWHNGARSTWFVKKPEDSVDSDVLTVGFFNRKANLGRLRPAVGYRIHFTEDRTTFKRTDVADSPDLAAQLSIRQRMVFLLQRGAMSAEAIAGELDANVETVKRTGRRNKELFTVIDGGRRFGLLARGER